MNFTFGIVTGGGPVAEQRIRQALDSIIQEHIPSYEVVIVGNVNLSGANIKVLPFDEAVRPGWITKKKNLITQTAMYENIVYMHDYLRLEPGWYEGWKMFGENYSLGMNRILNFNGARFRDWVMWVDDAVVRALAQAGAGTNDCILPYTESLLNKFQYFSGSYWVAKKSVMQEFPLNESLLWDQGEDVEWSMRVRNKYPFSMNTGSSVRFMKEGKNDAFTPISQEKLARVKEILGVSYPMNSIEYATKLVSGDMKHVLEFGVGDGKTTRQIRNGLDMSYGVFGFDCFEGLPDDWIDTKQNKVVLRKGMFSTQGKIPDVTGVTFFKGLFKDTIPEYIKIAKPITLLHIDCDLYNSTKDVLYGLNDYIVPGTILVFDEWIYLSKPECNDHEQKAFYEWIEDKRRTFSFVPYNDTTANGCERKIAKVIS